jgi:hypothetical protein
MHHSNMHVKDEFLRTHDHDAVTIIHTCMTTDSTSQEHLSLPPYTTVP